MELAEGQTENRHPHGERDGTGLRILLGGGRLMASMYDQSPSENRALA